MCRIVPYQRFHCNTSLCAWSCDTLNRGHVVSTTVLTTSGCEGNRFWEILLFSICQVAMAIRPRHGSPTAACGRRTEVIGREGRRGGGGAEAAVESGTRSLLDMSAKRRRNRGEGEDVVVVCVALSVQSIHYQDTSLIRTP